MIHWHTYTIFKQYAKPGQTIIELGDQLMDVGENTRYMRSDVFFKRQGLAIQSIDWHGKNRALKLDLSRPIEQQFEADLLTDFGTVEHVNDLYHALLNCHNFTKEGGTMIHANPKTGTYPGHGVSFFTQDFWKELAKACGYEVIMTDEKHPYSDSNPDIEVIAVLKKLPASVFPTQAEFAKIKENRIFNT